MAVIALTGKRRESLGKGSARKARKSGEIPGVLYGHGEKPVALSVARARSRWRSIPTRVAIRS